MNKKWTKKEEELLRKLAPSQSDVEIGKQLGRSNNSVRNKRKRMGLSQPELSIEDFIERDILKEEKQLSDKKVKHLLKENKFLKRERDALLKVKGVKTYKISQKKVPNECNAVTVTSTSDIHYEEPVKLSQVNGLNEYNTTIAKQRIEKLFKMTAKLIEVHKREYIIKTHILALLGDFISGSIHDDLMEVNAMQPTDAIWEVQNLIASGIEYLLENTDVDLLIPCSAGNHCVDQNTEILTNNGFKKAKNISENDIVASFDKLTGKMSYDKVEAIRKFSERGAYYIYGNQKDELVTSEHNLVINNQFVKAKDFTEADRDEFRYTCDYKTSGINLTDNELRLITWIVMDGTIVDNSKYIKNSTKRRIQFKLSRERKIEVLTNLLGEMNIPFTIKPATMSENNVLQPYLIRIYGDEARKYFSLLNNVKQFPDSFREMSKEQLDVVLDTITITDGRQHGIITEWSSIKKHDINVIQHACINNGIYFQYKRESELGGFSASDRKFLYTCYIYRNGFNKKVNRITRSKFVNRKVNFVGIQTKNGTIITRRNGKVNFTGNSRITAKQRVATEFGNSLEILIYRNLQLYFANNKRVTFIISDSYHTYVEVLGFTCRFHHGHAIRYAGGVGGITIPVNKAINEWNKSKRADFDFFGHFHQLFWGGNFVCNGSVIGYNPYAIRIKAPYEDPRQAFTLITEDRGIDVVRPINLK